MGRGEAQLVVCSGLPQDWEKANFLESDWFGLEGTLKVISFQLPCCGQGHLPLDQAAQGPTQPGLERIGFPR